MKKNKKPNKKEEKEKKQEKKQIILEVSDPEDEDEEFIDNRDNFHTFISRQTRRIDPSLVQRDRPIVNLEDELGDVEIKKNENNDSPQVSYSAKVSSLYAGTNNNSSPTSLYSPQYSIDGSNSSKDPGYSPVMRLDSPMQSGKEMNMRGFNESMQGTVGTQNSQQSDNYILPFQRKERDESLPFDEKKK